MSVAGKGWLIFGGIVLIVWGIGKVSNSGQPEPSPRGSDGWPPRTKPPYEVQKPVLSHLSTNSTNAHLCEKPDDAIYQGAGNRVVAPVDRQYHDATFLFDANHSDGTINWANGFKGTVPVCYLIDVKGMPTNITFFQPPGAELERHIRERIEGWRYKPATYIDGWRDENPKPIPVQMAVNFSFE